MSTKNHEAYYRSVSPLEVLDTITDTGWTVEELAEELGVFPPTVQSVLDTLLIGECVDTLDGKLWFPVGGIPAEVAALAEVAAPAEVAALAEVAAPVQTVPVAPVAPVVDPSFRCTYVRGAADAVPALLDAFRRADIWGCNLVSLTTLRDELGWDDVVFLAVLDMSREYVTLSLVEGRHGTWGHELTIPDGYSGRKFGYVSLRQ